MLENPLFEDSAIAEEFGIKEVHDIPKDQKLAYIQAQLGELKQMAWRERVNILHAKRLQKSDIQALAMKGNSNIVEHSNSLKQFLGAIEMLATLQEQMEAAE